MIGFQAHLDASQQRTLLVNDVRKLSPSYAAAELLWYLSGSGDVGMLIKYAPSYKKFAEENGHAYGAYGPRAMPQMATAIECLRNAGHTRQCVVALWRPDDLEQAVQENTRKDLPCTLHWQFLLRDGKLHMVVSMRSNDAWLGLPYDVFCFTAIQRLVAAELDAQPGLYCHQVGSMHLYQRNREQTALAIRRPDRSEGHGWQVSNDTLVTAGQAVSQEACIRAGWEDPQLAMGDMCSDLVAACGGRPTLSPDFRRLQERKLCDT